jgi:kynureninase
VVPAESDPPVKRDRAVALDRDDPLSAWRDEFLVNDPGLVYLDGNSLGMTPRRTVDALQRVVTEQWAGDLIRSWWDNDWLRLPLTVGDALAPVLGARPGEVAVHDSTTVCIFQLVNAALDLGTARHVIAIDAGEFPTDRYVAEGVARLRAGEMRLGFDDLDGVDVVLRSMVDYRTAEIADVAAETARAAGAGATTVWDLSHAAGVLDLDVHGLGIELAVGCTYKFLNGGPGSPAFTYVDAALHDRLVQPIWGWFAQRDQFDMDRSFDPLDGVARLLNGTPGVLGLIGAREGIALTAEAGMTAIAAKARQLTAYGLELIDALGLESPTPRDAARRGGHVAVRHPEAVALHGRLEDLGIIVDKRDPDILRLGMSPLTTRYTDVYDAVIAIDELVHIP